MDWKSYEELTKDIYQRLGAVAGVTVECWGQACRVRGASGIEHQIDVLTSHTDGLHKYRTAIECKHWKIKVGKSHVALLRSVIDDTGIEKGVLVSLNGFTRPAIEFAKSKNIGLVRLRRLTDADWEGFIRRVKIDLCLLLDVVVDAKVTLKRIESTKVEPPKHANDLSLVTRAGATRSLRDIMDDVMRLPISDGQPLDRHEVPALVTCSSEDGLRVYSLEFDSGTNVVDRCGRDIAAIARLDFSVEQRSIQDTVHIDAADRVSWILEAMFEKTSFAISPENAPVPWQLRSNGEPKGRA